MKYELHLIDAIVTKTLHSDYFEPASFTPKLSRNLIVQLQKDEDRIKEAWKEYLFSSADIKATELYIQNTQTAIIFLANQLDNNKDKLLDLISISNRSIKKYVTALYDQAEQTLRKLLEYIETFFRRFFDMSANVPNFYFAMAQKELKEKLQQLGKIIPTPFANDKLTTSFLENFESLVLSRKSASVSFREVIYLKELIHEILLLPTDEKDWLESLRSALLYMNFNSAEIIISYKKEFKKQLQELNNDDEKLLLLREWRKKLQYIRCRPYAALHLDWPSLQEWLLSWIDETKENFEDVEKVASPKEDPESLRLKTPLSVAQIGLFLWLMFETGLIISGFGKKSAVVRRVITAFSSKQKDKIEFESFRSKMYRRYNSDIRAVKDVLIKMLNKANELMR